MKLDFESLSNEPLFYMLMHSGAFVCVLGFIFFVIGLLFGYATWGRYKRQTRLLLGEASSMKDEIASLKRKVGDQAILPGHAIPMATETIQMPKKEGGSAARATPAITAETLTTQDIPVTTTPAQAASPEKEQPQESAPAVAPETTTEPAATSTTPSAEELPSSAPDASPHAKEAPESAADAPPAPEGQAPADTLPALTELLLPALPDFESQVARPAPNPETPRDSVLDPKLGFIYKTRPEKVDDLTVIEGISPVLEQRLQNLGIYTYEQIAAWDHDHVKVFSSRLAFKERIKRERWVEQARELAIKQTTV